MIFDRNGKKEVVALLGAGSMGTAIVRRIAAGRTILLGDISETNLEKVSHDLRYSGYDVQTMTVNALEKDSVEAFAEKADSLGPVMYFIDTAGASPNQAKPEHILALDMVGTGYALDAFGRVMAPGGAGLVISSQTGYMYPIPYEIEQEILGTPTEKLMEHPFIRETALQRSGVAYMIAKRVNHRHRPAHRRRRDRLHPHRTVQAARVRKSSLRRSRCVRLFAARTNLPQRLLMNMGGSKYEKIALQAWFPLGHGDKTLFEQPVFTALAEKHGKSVGQIILRWHIQMGNIVIPGARSEAHIRENIDIFDFALTGDEMAAIAAIDRGVPYITHREEDMGRYLNWHPDIEGQR